MEPRLSHFTSLPKKSLIESRKCSHKNWQALKASNQDRLDNLWSRQSPQPKKVSTIPGFLNDETNSYCENSGLATRCSYTMIGLIHLPLPLIALSNCLTLELKLYKQTPDNGLILFCGVILLEDGKSEKKLTIDFEPFIPQIQFVYKC